MLYGKTSGTTEVPKILGSMVFTADPVHPGWTRIDMVRQLNTNGHSDEPEKLQNWLQGFYDGLQSQLAGTTVASGYCVLPVAGAKHGHPAPRAGCSSRPWRSSP